jgi:hypothetical protein
MDNRTFNEIREEIVNRINQIQDPQTGYNFDIDVNDPTDLVAVIVNDIALQILDKNEQLLRIRSSLNPYKATGQELRDVIEYRGLTAKKGVPTTAKVNFTGTPAGILIPAGTKFTNNDETKNFLTSKDVTTVEDGQTTADIYCDQVGPILLAEDELTKISPPIPSLEISNIIASNIGIGMLDEIDKDIHLRLEQSSGSIGGGFEDIMDSALNNLDGVRSATTYVGPQNDIPANTMCSVVYGGTDNDVAKTIFEKNMFLMKYEGNTTVNVTSEYLRRIYEIKFERPEDQILTIYLKYKSLYPETATDINRIILGDIQSFLTQSNPGGIIYGGDMITFINNLNGVYKIVNISFSESDQVSFIAVAWNKIPKTNATNLHIEVIT